jgi:hypothetical protein
VTDRREHTVAPPPRDVPGAMDYLVRLTPEQAFALVGNRPRPTCPCSRCRTLAYIIDHSRRHPRD